MSLSATSMMRDKVISDSDGRSLGKISDFLIDTDNGAVVYAVLSYGGVMGIGDKYFTVPMQALQLDADNECFYLKISSEYFNDSPGFDKDNWPDAVDTTISDALIEDSDS